MRDPNALALRYSMRKRKLDMGHDYAKTIERPRSLHTIMSESNAEGYANRR